MDYKTEIIGAFISFVIAVLTGWFTARQTYKGEIKKSVYEEREKLYVDLFAILDDLQRQPELMYDYSKFILNYKQIRAKSKLYASSDVLLILQPFNDRLNECWKQCERIYSEEQIEREIERQLYEDEQNGLCRKKSEIEFLIIKEKEQFLEKNQITMEEIQEIIESLSCQIRNELMIE